MLYRCFVKEMVPKCGCLVDFFAISLPTKRAYTHAHPVLCLKLEENQLVDRSLHIEKMLIIYLSQKKRSKVGFLYSMLFYGCLNHFVRMWGFITFLW